ncbi:MAG: lysophospholipid acyltransferase family protein [Fimbriimonadaceae bacterium]
MRSQKRKELEGRLGAWFFRRIQRWVEKKDALQAEKAGAKLGRFIYRVSKKHRNRALANLELAMPELSIQERERIAKGVFEHFGMVGTDFMRTMKRSDQEVIDSITMEGFEHVESALALGKGVLVITGHFGNWERLGQYARAKGFTMHVVARDANDSKMNQIMMDLRGHAGLNVLPRGNAARQMLGLLKDNQLVAVLPDQNSSETFVPFFGKPCGTVQGPAVLHLRTGAPLLPSFCARVGPGKYRLMIKPHIQPEPGFDGPEAYTRAINNAIEEVIREYPEQWLWLHDRWKSARRAGLL